MSVTYECTKIEKLTKNNQRDNWSALSNNCNLGLIRRLWGEVLQNCIKARGFISHAQNLVVIRD